ncbi:MAG TPA: PDZ domain-containing protein [Sandaracinaceae bacterium]
MLHHDHAGARRLAIVVLAAFVAGACVYPRRGTSLSPVRREGAASVSAPADLWQLTLVSAQITPRKRGNLPWDEGGGEPDPFVRVYRGEELLFESPTIEDAREPEWNVTLPRNVRIPRDRPLRFEVWDRDTVGADPIGQIRTHGLPVNAMPGADARLLLEGGSYLTIRVAPPLPHRGTGIEEYEMRPDALVVIRVLAYSPAQRAGLESGDAIVAIDDRRIADMESSQAASALSMASHRRSRLTVRGADGRERTVQLDRDFVWLTM